MGVNLPGNFIDAYDRAARLYPSLICLLPVVAVSAGVYGTALSLNSALVTLVTSFGGLFLLMSVSRDLGKRLEPGLYASWGGKPTTQLLRHSDNVLDPVTKKRFHGFLERHLDIAFPTPEDEATDPVRADGVYQSGTQWLLGKTRDRTKFPFVFKENGNYGFRRNCLGLKPVGIVIAVLATIWTLAASEVFSATGVSVQKIADATVGAKVALVVTLGMAFVWTFLITKGSVRRVAFAYADMLLRACDVLPKKR
jgi:hypothetical protein